MFEHRCDSLCAPAHFFVCVCACGFVCEHVSLYVLLCLYVCVHACVCVGLFTDGCLCPALFGEDFKISVNSSLGILISCAGCVWFYRLPLSLNN